MRAVGRAEIMKLRKTTQGRRTYLVQARGKEQSMKNGVHRISRISKYRRSRLNYWWVTNLWCYQWRLVIPTCGTNLRTVPRWNLTSIQNKPMSNRVPSHKSLTKTNNASKIRVHHIIMACYHCTCRRLRRHLSIQFQRKKALLVLRRRRTQKSSQNQCRSKSTWPLRKMTQMHVTDLANFQPPHQI